MTTASDLPPELHAEIVQCLHHYRDRPTLISTALVSKDWCTLSQRILFSTVTDHWYDNTDRRECVRSTHIQFLQTIAEYPDRLGPLVQSYAQDSLACNPAASIPWRVESLYEVWTLTEKALPAMVNLQHLYLSPLTDSLPAADGWASSRKLLRSFTFQLKTLTWGSYFHPENGVPEFLRTQHNLAHLESGRYPFSLSLSWLEDDICPHVVSVTGGFNSLSHVAQSRKIIAWKWCPTNERGQALRDSSALESLKYLSVHNYKSFRTIFGHIDLGVQLLELEDGAWKFDTPLANLPSLRVLVLVHGLYYTAPDQKLAQIAIDCFKWLPSLEYIIVRRSRRHWKEYHYEKLSLFPGSAEEIVREELNIHYDIAAPWWTIYNI